MDSLQLAPELVLPSKFSLLVLFEIFGARNAHERPPLVEAGSCLQRIALCPSFPAKA